MAETLFHLLNGFFTKYTVFIISYFVAINSVYLLLIVFSFLHIRRQIEEKDVYEMHGLFASNLYSPISILAPAFNEEATVSASVHSLLQLRFPNYEIIVINDGSKDRTLDVLIEEFELERVERYVPLILDHKPIRGIYRSKRFAELVVVDKENGRKADALNAGVNVCRNDLFCAIDADCVLEPNVLQNMLRCFIEDETTIAVGGIVRVANDCVIEGNEIKEIRMPKAFLARIQVVEYLRAFLFGRVGWDFMDSLLIISGAFGIFDRNAVLRVGGYLHDTVGEDMELVVRLHRYHREQKIPYRVRFLPEPVCWTEVPESVNILSRQRNRWHRGLADTLWRHRKMMFNPKYGRLGMFAMPFFLIFELLSPVIELIGYITVFLMIVFGMFNSTFAALIFTATVLLGVVLSVASVLCEEYTFRRYTKVKDVMIMIAFAFIENFGFRQVHALWRFKGLVDFIRGKKEWGVMTRKGFGTKPEENKPKAIDESVKVDEPVPEIVSVLEGAPEYRVGQRIENYDAYSEKAQQIKNKYAGKRNDSGKVVEDDEYKDAFNRRSWTKTILPVIVLFGTIIVIALWIRMNANNPIPVTSTTFTSDTIISGFTSVLSPMPVYLSGVMVEPQGGFEGLAFAANRDGFQAGVASANQLAPTTEGAQASQLATGDQQPSVSQPQASQLATGDQQPSVSQPGTSELLPQIAHIQRAPETGRYFIVEHTFMSNQRLEYLQTYRNLTQNTGFQFFAIPVYRPNFEFIAWQVGFGPFRSAQDALNYMNRHGLDVNQLQIRNSARPDMSVFDFAPSSPTFEIMLTQAGTLNNQIEYIRHLESLGFRNIRTGPAPDYAVYIGLFDREDEAQNVVRFVLGAYGIRNADVVSHRHSR